MRLPRPSFAVFSALIVLCALFAPALGASSPYPASDVLGQLGEGDAAYFTSGGTNDAPNTRGFNRPHGVALDPVHHRLFVSEFSNNRILVFNLNTSNVLSDRVADYVIGQPDFKTNTAGTTAAKLFQPYAITYDTSTDRLYAADRFNHRVLVFNASTVTNGMSASYVLGQQNFTSAAQDTTSSSMRFPLDIKVDHVGNRLFVSDCNNSRVIVFDLSAGITSGMSAVNVIGQADLVSSSTVISSSSLRNPNQIDLDESGQRLFVTDSNNNRVLVFDVATSTFVNGMAATAMLGQTSFTSSTGGTTSSTFSFPAGVAYQASSSRLFIGDMNNNRVLVFDIASITNGEGAVNVLGQSSFTSSTATTTQASARLPAYLLYDSGNQYLYVPLGAGSSATHRVSIFDVASVSDNENAVDGLGQLDENDTPVWTASSTDGGINNRGFNFPRKPVIDHVRHRLFVPDASNNRVLVFALDASDMPADRRADYVLGQNDMRSNGSGATQSRISGPAATAFDEANNRLFVTDGGNSRVLIYDFSSGITNGMNASYVLGQPNFTQTSASTSMAGLGSFPQGLAFDSSTQRLFVVDQGNGRVLVFNLSSGITNGMAASYAIGSPGAASSTTLLNPYDIALDMSGQLMFVDDYDHTRIVIFSIASGTIANGMAASYVLGQPNFSSNTQATTQSGMSTPTGVAYDETRKRLFVMTNGQRILIFDLSSGITNGMDASAVLGQISFTSSSSIDPSQGSASFAYGLYVDELRNKLYVPSGFSHRLMIFDFSSIAVTTPELSWATAGQNYNQSITASGIAAPAYSIASGTLPVGLALVSSTGAFSGSPTAAGAYRFTVRASDSLGGQGSFLWADKEYALEVVSAQSFAVGTMVPFGPGAAIPAPPTASSSISITSATSTPAVSGSDANVLRAQLAELLAQLRGLQKRAGISSMPPALVGVRQPLYVGQQGPVILKLQKFLNTHAFTVAKIGPGSPGQETDRFGAATWAAIARFQEYYAKDILEPAGLTRGTGVVGPKTWAKLLELGWE